MFINEDVQYKGSKNKNCTRDYVLFLFNQHTVAPNKASDIAVATPP